MALVLAQLLAFSALATDVAQTQHWIHYPPGCYDTECPGYDANPLVAGQPEKFERLVDFMEAAISASVDVLPPRLAGALLTVMAASNATSAITNNKLAPQSGFPAYVMVAYTWRF